MSIPTTDADVRVRLAKLGLSEQRLVAALGLYRAKRALGSSVLIAYENVLNVLAGDAPCPPVEWPEHITEAQKGRARQLVAPQPSPKNGDGSPVWPMVIRDVPKGIAPRSVATEGEWAIIADMIARDEYGRKKYKSPLTANNGRDNLVDWYQEALDGLAYARSEIEGGDATGVGEISYHVQMSLALDLRMAIYRRDGK